MPSKHDLAKYPVQRKYVIQNAPADRRAELLETLELRRDTDDLPTMDQVRAACEGTS